MQGCLRNYLYTGYHARGPIIATQKALGWGQQSCPIYEHVNEQLWYVLGLCSGPMDA